MAKLIERQVYAERIKGFIDTEQIKVITGVRRCGKSEILKLIQAEVLKRTDKEHIIFIDFEDLEFNEILDYMKLHDYVTDRIKDDKTHYIFLDEIQKVKGWERVVASLRKKNTDIYIAGSNAQLLSGELATLIAGRYVAFEINTLSFSEFNFFRKTSGIEDNSSEPSKMLDEYIKIGGFPILSTRQFGKDESRKIVADIHSSAVLKDVIERNNVKNIALLQRVISFIYDNIGKLVSVRNIEAYLKNNGGGSFETISNYITFLENACIIRKAPRYEIKGKKLLESNDKYYLADHSLQYAVRDMREENMPGILENIIFNELVYRGYNVYVGKMSKDDNREIDFVAEKYGGNEKVYVQVCYDYSLSETREREFAPLTEIKDLFPKYVVSYKLFGKDNANGVVGIKLSDFLLKDSF
ncbi:MAG: ATP-binding protein [Firmicutes bacterium]|nr:ATP-binding protein [Bacillota bacterium]